VRRAAAERLSDLDPEAAARLGAALLDDPARTVRLEAASSLTGARAALPAEAQGPLDVAVREFRRSQAFNADRAESHLNLGNLELALGRLDAAERSFRTAARREERFVPAWVNLADVLRATGRDTEGERALRRALATAPESAVAHHALGLTLIRLGRTDEALLHLGAAARLAPSDTRLAFVHAVALHDTGDLPGAIAALQVAHDARPDDPDVLAALAQYCMEAGRIDEARTYAARRRAIDDAPPSLETSR
jgi:tetratricopeptide (TPR) repeat protein